METSRNLKGYPSVAHPSSSGCLLVKIINWVLNLGSIRLDVLSDWCIQTCLFSQCWEKIDFSLLVFDLVVRSVFASNSSWSQIFSFLWSPKTTLGQNQFSNFMLIKKEKKYELNGDVALVFKENGKCLKL